MHARGGFHTLEMYSAVTLQKENVLKEDGDARELLPSSKGLTHPSKSSDLCVPLSHPKGLEVQPSSLSCAPTTNFFRSDLVRFWSLTLSIC